jgi:hypothetical protein
MGETSNGISQVLADKKNGANDQKKQNGQRRRCEQ